MATEKLRCSMRDINSQIWSCYMSEKYHLESDASKMAIIQDIFIYIIDYISLKNITKIKNHYIIELDFELFSKYPRIEDLNIMLRNSPNETLKLLNIAFHLYLTKENRNRFPDLMPNHLNEIKSKIKLRIFNFGCAEVNA